MGTYIVGDRDFEEIPSLSAKALRINLNKHIYGTFSEIGAGQETVRYFFRAGGASGTIAKAVSAYDKNFSDALYGAEKDGRYVTEGRLKKTLSHEIKLLEERLPRDKYPDKLFFTYANTVTTIDFAKRYKGHGWVGIRFQTEPEGGYNDIILHIRFHQTETRAQQETLGKLGVNLIHSAFYKSEKPHRIIKYLYDHIDKDLIEIDMINFSGPKFAEVDNRLMSLQLIKNGMTEAVMFDADGNNQLPAEQLYKKNILTLRGSFRPVTNVNIDMLKRSLELFLKEKEVDENNTQVIFEITLSNLLASGELDEQDFMDRARILSSLGYKVLISNFKEYYRLAEYFSNYTKAQMGMVMGADNLIAIFDEEYYTHLSGGILEAFGKLFYRDIKIYLYPMRNKETGEIITSNNIHVSPRMKELYKFFKFNEKLVDIENYDAKNLNIRSRDIVQQIKRGQEGWQAALPKGVAEMIEKNGYFGWNKDKKEE